MSRLASSLLAIASLPAALLASGCPEPTPERAGCPAGERCSPLTPDGLAVVSRAAGAGDTSMLATAVDGTQTFDLIDPTDGAPLAAPYAIETSGPQVLAATAGAAVTFRAFAAGPTLVRIYDPETGDLYDTTTIRAEVAATVDVRSTERALDDRPVVWLDGAAGDAVLEIRDAAGAPLVDERAQVGWADRRDALVRGAAWNVFQLSGRDDSANLVVRAGNRPFDVAIHRVARVDSIVGFVAESDAEMTLVCFEARVTNIAGAGPDPAVAGLAWRFEVAGQFAPSAGHPNCTAVPTAGPERTVVGKVGDMSSALVVGQP